MRAKKPTKFGSTVKHKGKGFRKGPYLKSESALFPPDTSGIPWMRASTAPKTGTED
jgi:hypothetical protein